MSMNDAYADVDAYLASVPEPGRAALQHLRATIHELAPGAEESISYGMPTFKFRGKRLIYFAAARQHLAIYGVGDGTIRFPPSDPPSRETMQSLLDARLAVIESELAKPKRTPRPS